MIILDDQVPILKTSLGRPEQQEAPFGYDASDLEAGSSSHILPPPPYTPRPTDPLLHRVPDAPESPEYQRRAWRNRIWTIAAVYGMWVFTAGLLSRLLPVDQPQNSPSPAPEPTPTGSPNAGIPISENSCLGSVRWSSHTIDKHGLEIATTTLLLPAAVVDRPLSFTSVGFAHGSIIFTAEPAHEGDELLYTVLAAHPKRKTLDVVTVCLNRINGGGYQMGVMSPEADPDFDPSEPVSYHIRVNLPNRIGSGPAPPLYPSLHVNMPNFDIALAHANNVQFGSILLATADADVTVNPYTASDDIDIFTTNGQINGSFRVTSALALRGDNVDVTCVAGLTQTANSAAPPSMDISMTNGLINATVNLHSIGEPSRGGTFDVRATGDNTGGQINFPWAPVNSTLRMNATFTNGGGYAKPFQVTLPAAFEGGFAVKSGRHPMVKERSNIEDPSGAGRKRVVNVVNLPSLKFGTVVWKTPDLEQAAGPNGEIALTSAGDVTLVV